MKIDPYDEILGKFSAQATVYTYVETEDAPVWYAYYYYIDGEVGRDFIYGVIKNSIADIEAIPHDDLDYMKCFTKDKAERQLSAWKQEHKRENDWDTYINK
jgi:hypothetical protein